MIRPDIREVCRYLGIRTGKPDPEIAEAVERCMNILEEAVHPVHALAYYPLTFEGETVCFADVKISSHDLYRNLEGCTEICIYAGTLGIETDRLIRKTSVRSVLDGAVMQAVSAASIEAYTDRICRQIESEANERNLYCHPRYSPGYGDLSLAVQKDIFRLMDLPKKTGMSLTDTLLMVPSKSVTAFTGLGPEPVKNRIRSCTECSMYMTCTVRKEEG